MTPSPTLSIAPMMDRTDRHFRYLMRLISKHVLLYTEMVVARAVFHGDRERLLGYEDREHPIALQLGGEDPQLMAKCARIAEDFGYDEVNINVGCPSDRVREGRFGARLMAEPARVRDCVAAMKAEVRVPVTVKHRIGIDDRDRYDDMLHFVDVVAEAEPARFTVHARKAWLSGLSPKENRTVPPLRYHDVYRLARERPQLQVEINGGITGLGDALEHLRHVDAVMVGRAAYDDPFAFVDADRVLFRADCRPPTPEEVVEAMIPYTARWVERGGRAHAVYRHLLGLFSGRPGARAFRRVLSIDGVRPDAGVEVLEQALAHVRRGAASGEVAQARA
jgi:tRNA-dihydrouridine synthase A